MPVVYKSIGVDTKINKYLNFEIILYKENIFIMKNSKKTYALSLYNEYY
jgi:hypothetical protein